MDNVKLRLSLYVPGAQMLSREESLKNPKESHDTVKMTVNVEANKKKPKTEILTVETRKSRLVRQNVNLTLEAFLYMTGKETPYFSTPSQWLRMSKKERLKEHLDRIAQNFNAVSYTYDVLDD